MESEEESGSGGSTPVQDEPVYKSGGEEPMSVDEPSSPKGRRNSGSNGNNSGDDSNAGGEGQEVGSGREGDKRDSDDDGNRDHSDEDRPVGSPMSGPQSPDQESRSAPQSPSAFPNQRSRSGSRSPSHSLRSGSGSRGPRSKSGSRSRSGSRSPTHRSRSGSGSPGRRSRSGSGSPGSRSRSGSGSPGHRSRSGSGSPGRRSRSGSGSPGRRSRSGSGSPGRRSRSGSGSPGPRSRSGSGSPGLRPRSGSGSPSRRSRSGSGSPSRRSRSGSRSPGQGSRAGSLSPGRRSAGSASLAQSPGRQDSRHTEEDGKQRDASQSDADSDSEQPKARTPGPADYSDDDDESDKGSAVGGLIADIFGSSDEDEEFEGFGVADVEAPVKKKEKKKTAVVSDDDDDDDDNEGGEGGAVDVSGQGDEAPEEDAPTQDAEGGGDAPTNMSDDDEMKEDFVSDFELMMMKKKEESQKFRKKRRDVDIINDNDDLIADMINKMKTAAEEDRTANEKRTAATKKMKYLPAVQSQLKKADLHIAFLDCGVLSAITEWLAPLPDRSLPHVQIRDSMLKFLSEFPPMSSDTLKSSGIGKAVMYLYKHPRETRDNKERAGKLINEWSRPIFNLTSNFKNLSREERQQRDYEQLPKKRRLSSDGSQTPRRDIDKALSGEEKALRPGDPGWIYRARVPNPSHKDYVVRPRWNVEELVQKGASKKQVTRYEKHMRAFKEKKKGSKNQRAVTISIEGRNMSL